MRGKLVITMLVLVALSGIASAALFKFPITTTDAAIGDIVGPDGLVCGAGDRDAVGFVIAIEEGGATDTILVANSGVYDVTLPGGITAGDRLTTGAAGAVAASTNDEDPLVGIALEAGGATATIMIIINDAQAKYTAFDTTGTGLTGENVQDVIEELDSILDNSAALENKVATIGTTNEAIDGDWENIANVILASAPTEVYLDFSGNFDDRGGNSGAYMEIRLVGNGTNVIGEVIEIALIDRSFFQIQEASNSLLYDNSGTTYTTFGVQARLHGGAAASPYDSGRFINGSFSVIELK